MNKIMDKPKYKTIDFFCGIGGVRRGFELTKYFENILSAEVDKFACTTYEHLYGKIHLMMLQVRNLKKKSKIYDVFVSRIFLVNLFQ